MPRYPLYVTSSNPNAALGGIYEDASLSKKCDCDEMECTKPVCNAKYHIVSLEAKGSIYILKTVTS